MTCYLQAPHSLIQTTIMLPSPQLGDAVMPQSEVTISNSMSGQVYSYVKSNDRLKIIWEFNALTLEKATELREFIDTYLNYSWRAVDHIDRVYVVNLVNVPVEFTSVSRGEYRSCRLEMEGKQVV